LIEGWRIEYKTERPHSSLGYLTPEQFALTHEVKTFQPETRIRASRFGSSNTPISRTELSGPKISPRSALRMSIEAAPPVRADTSAQKDRARP
jgi:hypothetical protein